MRSLTARSPVARVGDLNAVFMTDGQTSVSWGAFLAHARQLAGELPAGSHIVNLCEGRYAFSLGFVAAMMAGQVTVLPAATAVGTANGLPESYPYPIGGVLIDEGRAIASPLSQRELPGTAPGGLPRVDAIPDVDDQQVACVVFSSGSTGAPTPHIKRWGALAQAGRDIGTRFGFAPGRQAIAGSVPPRHMFGLETTVLLPLQWGSSLYTGRPLLPADVDIATRSLRGERWLMTTPIQLRALADDALCHAAFEAAISATMPLSAPLAAQVEGRFGSAVYEIYGCTEAGSLATRRTSQSAEWETLAGIVVEHRDGSAWVSGGHVAEPTPLGDLVTLTDATRFHLGGRAAHMVKVGGKRTSLEALNAVLTEIPGVLDGAFFVPEDAGDTRTRLVAFAVAPGMTASGVVAELRGRLDPVFVPRPLYLVTLLPRNDLGKLTRRDLADMAGRLSRTGAAVRG
jgi:acyl-coenzyme A synthetase/AMP-(fatty) acid ligase